MWRQRKFSEAEKILLDGVKLKSDWPYYRPALAKVYGAWSDVLRNVQKDPRGQLRLLEEALRYDPGNRVALSRMIDLRRSTDPKTKKHACEYIQELLFRDSPSATLHLLLGNDEWRQGNREAAVQHLEKACRFAPDIEEVANNLAWVLAHSDRSELPRALELINSVVDRWPDNPHYRETRGQILAKLGRWKRAVSDLEFALRAHLEAPNLHQTLAVVYENLSDGEMALKHRQLAAAEGK